MRVYQVYLVHYDDLPYDYAIQVKASSEAEALEIANRRCFSTKWWPQQPVLKTWGHRDYACKPRKFRSE